MIKQLWGHSVGITAVNLDGLVLPLLVLYSVAAAADTQEVEKLC